MRLQSYSARDWALQELYLWALSRPRESLPSEAEPDADTASKPDTTDDTGKASDGKPVAKVSASKPQQEVSDFISAGRSPAKPMNGLADDDHGSAPGDKGSGKPWKAAYAKSVRTDPPLAAHLSGVNSSGRGTKHDGSGRGARPTGHVSSRASEDSSAPPSLLVLVGDHIDAAAFVRVLIKWSHAAMQMSTWQRKHRHAASQPP